MREQYTHLSREQRYSIDRMPKQGKSKTVIADTIGVHRSTVSREIARNKTEKGGVYSYNTAQMYANERKEWRQRRFSSWVNQRFIALLQRPIVNGLREKVFVRDWNVSTSN